MMVVMIWLTDGWKGSNIIKALSSGTYWYLFISVRISHVLPKIIRIMLYLHLNKLKDAI